MKKIFVAIAMICSMVSTSSFASEVRAAQSAIKNQMKDPDSTKFKSVREITNSQGGRFVCGEVNSKTPTAVMWGLRLLPTRRGEQ